jgi:anti-anti-sigma factor
MLAEVSLEERSGISVARVIGEVDLSNAGDLTATMQKAVQRTSAGLVLDLSETTYLDSSGLHFVFELGKRLRDRGQHLELVVPTASPVAAILEIVGIGLLAPVSRTLDEAVAKLEEHAADVPPTAPGESQA